MLLLDEPLANMDPVARSEVTGELIVVPSLCPGHRGSLDPQCLAQHHFVEALRYQPGSRIPDFHLILACDYLALGAIAVAIVWWLARRTSPSAG